MKFSIILMLIFSCGTEFVPTRSDPRHFKVTFNFDIYDPGIKVLTTFGKEKKKYFLQLDNHSPSWIDDNLLDQTRAVRKVKNISYSTSVADGGKIKGNVYVCDTVTVATIRFNDVLFYKINDTGSKANGVIGENILSLGVWMMDFEMGKITFTSSVDSLEKRVLYEGRLLPTSFTDNNFHIQSVFSNGTHKKFSVDIGYNGGAMLPLKDFNDINSKVAETHRVIFGTPNGKQILNSYTAHEKVLLGNDSVSFVYSTNEKVAESVVGLGFFKQFRFVVLDYPNKQIYVSRD